jgi:nicotinamide-nucleotide amidase
MQAEIITIGDEILIGQIVDTNSAFIAQEFNKIGVSIYQITSVQDDREHILQALKNAEENADVVIITGGLGPTKDDITKHTLCEYFDDHLVQDDTVLRHVEEIFARYSDRPLLQVNKDQALLPSKATTLFNEQGTAPGMWMKSKKDTVFVSLPGVPFEMKGLIMNQVILKIQSEYKLPFILHKTVITYGVGESALAEQIASWENQLPKTVKLAYLPSVGSVRLRLSTRGDSEEIVKNAIDTEFNKLHAIIGDLIYGIEGEEIQEVVANLFTAKKMTLATAESFTGGKIAEHITAMPGASVYYKGSVVSYATEAKINILNVPKEAIDEYSVVSAQVAEAMAVNVKNLLKSDFAIATTGNAGPSKGDSNEEVGTVFIAVATPTGVYSEQFVMGKQRERVLQKSVNKAFELLRKEILNF